MAALQPWLAQLAPLRAQANAWGKAAIMWANPSLNYNARPTAGWLLGDLDAALLVTACYLILIFAGVIRRATTSKPKAAPSEEKLSVSAKFANDKWLYFMTVYNLTQVALCFYMMSAAAYYAYTAGYSYVCSPFDQKDTTVTTVLYIFYLSKVLDFFDTFFIIVRGKWEQFSFLHTFHHFSIYLVYWLVSNAGYTGDTWYPVFANSFIHTLMYFYYFSTTLNYKPWWGRYLTQLQMVQFVTMMSQAVYILVKGCDYPHPLTQLYLGYIAFMLALFANFYRRRYAKAPGGGKAKGGKAA